MTDEICRDVRYAVIPDAPPAQAAGHPCIDRPLAYPADLVWRPDDPWAVELHIPASSVQPNPVTWRFALDLIGDGIDSPTGRGELYVAPVGERVEMVFDRPAGRTTLHFSADDIRRFLNAIKAVWAPVHVDDAELAAWIARAEQ